MSSNLVGIGVIVHAILLYSIFDIYYTSPVVTDVPAHVIHHHDIPADRLVVISADGLRLDTFTKNPELSPFLHSIIRDRKGVSGVSRSHVPTESRPGHVAMFAGFTEDVSAVARGWKKNPVPFDSVLNRSHEAWLWGSPDIVSLFDDRPHVHSFSYSEDDEDFGSNQAYKLDEWVFDEVTKFLSSLSSNLDLWKSANAPKRVFFLHLLGLDTNGHGNKPHSKEYKENLKVVDAGIERMVKEFDDIFPDKKTSWLFTADHGMTDWGSHGAGSDEEVLTPFVGWGAGFQKGGARRTISQVDLAPLMSSLLGLAVPVNSVGVLPIQVLDVSPQYIFRASYCNFLQLKEQILVLRAAKSHRLWFRDYAKFGDRALQALEDELLKLAKLRRHAAASSLFVDNAAAMKDAIYHYHRYDRGFLGAAVSLSFVAWILLVWSFLTSSQSAELLSGTILRPKQGFLLLFGALGMFNIYCRLPWTNHIYVLLPVFLLSMVENSTSACERFKLFVQDCVANYTTTSFVFLVRPFAAGIGLCVFLFLCVIVFLDRRFLSLIFVVLSLAPTAYTKNQVIDEWSGTWRSFCIALMPFPFLDTVGRTEIPLLCIGSPLVLGVLLLRFSKKVQHPYFYRLAIACLSSAALIFISYYVFDKPPFWVRLLSWTSLPFACISPLLCNTIITQRIVVFLVSLFIPYSLLSIAYESFFTLLFSPLLLLFLRFEFSHLTDAEFMRLSSDTPSPITKARGRVHQNEVRRAIICVCFVLCGLFGTGNFASLNSFNPSTLGRFISVFSPFTMATLLLAKLLIPLLMISLVIASVLRFDRNNMQRLSSLVLIITDLMAMCFFHQLKDDGSWLDIGMSISQYLVSMCMSVAILVLLLCSSRLMTTQLTLKSIYASSFKTQDCSL